MFTEKFLTQKSRENINELASKSADEGSSLFKNQKNYFKVIEYLKTKRFKSFKEVAKVLKVDEKLIKQKFSLSSPKKNLVAERKEITEKVINKLALTTKKIAPLPENNLLATEAVGLLKNDPGIKSGIAFLDLENVDSLKVDFKKKYKASQITASGNQLLSNDVVLTDSSAYQPELEIAINTIVEDFFGEETQEEIRENKLAKDQNNTQKHEFENIEDFLHQRLNERLKTLLIENLENHRADYSSLQENLKNFSLKTGPADAVAFHDFYEVQIAFKEVWYEIFDGKISPLSKELIDKFLKLDDQSLNIEEIEQLGKEEIEKITSEIDAYLQRIDNFNKPPEEALLMFPQLTSTSWNNLSPEERKRILNLYTYYAEFHGNLMTPDIFFEITGILQIPNIREVEFGTTPTGVTGENADNNWFNLNLVETMEKLRKGYNEAEEGTKLYFTDQARGIKNVSLGGVLTILSSLDLKMHDVCYAYDKAWYIFIEHAGIIVENINKIIDEKDQNQDSRLKSLIVELNERLLSVHKFDIFAPDTVNYGLLLNYRQKWNPVDYQVGNLVETIPLAPGESKTYKKKETINKKRHEKESENSNSTLRQDSKSTSRETDEIVKKASKKTNFNNKTELGFNIKILSTAKNTTDISVSGEKSSNRTKKDFREAIKNASEEYKNERKTEISTEESFSSSLEESGTITNPNDEITVTYLFYELQRRYKVSEKLHELTPIILVANEIPRPDEIDEDWIIANEWIIRKVLLDDLFIDALDYLHTGYIADEIAMEVAQSAYDKQLEILERVASNVESMTDLHSELQAMLNLTSTNEQIAKFNKKKSTYYYNHGAFGLSRLRRRNGMQLLEREDPFGLLNFGKIDGSAPVSDEAIRIQKEAFEARVDQTSNELLDLKGELANEMGAFEKAKTDYVTLLKTSIQKRAMIDQLKVHIKENILHYMQGIWNHEHPDQRYFRLYNNDVPWFECPISSPTTSMDPEITFHKTRKIPGIVDELEMERNNAAERIGYSIDFNGLKFGEAVPTKKLHQVANLDNLLGYKGNYMIFPMKTDNLWTCYMKQPYVALTPNGQKLYDPDVAGKYSISDIRNWLESKKQLGDHKINFEDKETLKGLLMEWMAFAENNESEIIVPTGSVYIDALPGAHPVLEDFKMKHRMIDVMKAEEERIALANDNLRREALLANGNFEDPDVDKVIKIKGLNGSPININE